MGYRPHINYLPHLVYWDLAGGFTHVLDSSKSQWHDFEGVRKEAAKR